MDSKGDELIWSLVCRTSDVSRGYGTAKILKIVGEVNEFAPRSLPHRYLLLNALNYASVNASRHSKLSGVNIEYVFVASFQGRDLIPINVSTRFSSYVHCPEVIKELTRSFRLSTLYILTDIDYYCVISPTSPSKHHRYSLYFRVSQIYGQTLTLLLKDL